MFISVKEAADLTGKSSTTIYRLCNKRLNTEYIKKEDNKFFIDKDYLLATYPPEAPDEEITDKPIEPIEVEKVEENVIKSTVDESVPPVVLEEEKMPENEETIETILENEEDVEKESTIELINESKGFYQNFGTSEVIIGVSASLFIIALIIYLLSLFAS